MNETPPDPETLRTAVALATRAPSVHNTQPWRWHVGETSLHLFADPSLQLPHTDPDGRDLIISCGAALNHCVVALAALGWQTRIHRLPNPAAASLLASIEVRQARVSDVDVTLAAAIPRRRTDRRVYSAWPVAPGDVALMGARAARLGVVMRRVEQTALLKTWLSRARREHVGDSEYLAELAMWSGRHGPSSRAAVRWRSRRKNLGGVEQKGHATRCDPFDERAGRFFKPAVH